MEREQLDCIKPACDHGESAEAAVVVGGRSDRPFRKRVESIARSDGGGVDRPAHRLRRGPCRRGHSVAVVDRRPRGAPHLDALGWVVPVEGHLGRGAERPQFRAADVGVKADLAAERIDVAEDDGAGIGLPVGADVRHREQVEPVPRRADSGSQFAREPRPGGSGIHRGEVGRGGLHESVSPVVRQSHPTGGAPRRPRWRRSSRG